MCSSVLGFVACPALGAEANRTGDEAVVTLVKPSVGVEVLDAVRSRERSVSQVKGPVDGGEWKVKHPPHIPRGKRGIVNPPQ